MLEYKINNNIKNSLSQMKNDIFNLFLKRIMILISLQTEIKSSLDIHSWKLIIWTDNCIETNKLKRYNNNNYSLFKINIY